MTRRPIMGRPGRLASWTAVAAVLAAAWSAGAGVAQTVSQPPAPAAVGAAQPIPTVAAGGAAGANGVAAAPQAIQQTGCSSCGGGLPPGDYIPGGCGDGGCCGCGGNCIPGRKPCCAACFDNDCFCGRFFNGVIQCLCCPDPCYEGHWIPVADSAFFVDAARPVNQMMLRYDDGNQFITPDRAEYFWGQEGVRGPKPPIGDMHYQDLQYYVEAGVERFSAFVEVPYREITTDLGPEHSGFADMTVGTKALWLDCELLQAAFEFKTFIPVGNVAEGLGTGHASLEPSLLFDIKVTSTDYIQFQTSYWIPIGGDPEFESNIWHNHVSWNHVWFCAGVFELVGTAECNEWTVFNGEFTDQFGNVHPSGGDTIVSMGPGMRLFMCDKFDLGVGSAFAVTGDRWEKELISVELRMRF